MNPRSWLLLPGEYVDILIDLILLWQRCPKLPDKYAAFIVFQGKPDGAGLRPLALIVSVLRVWARVRQQVVRSWEREHAAQFCYGERDKECDRAGWNHAMMSEFARIKRFHTAKATGLSLRLARAAIQLYVGARVLTFQGGISDIVHATGTILAGCSLATSFARVVLYRLLSAVAAAYPSLMIRNVIDDVSMQSIGTVRLVGEQLGGAGVMLKEGFEKLKLVPSGKKTLYTSSCKELAMVLNGMWG
eukprot:9492425-Pyramimonas_sp.AAC.1